MATLGTQPGAQWHHTALRIQNSGPEHQRCYIPGDCTDWVHAWYMCMYVEYNIIILYLFLLQNSTGASTQAELHGLKPHSSYEISVSTYTRAGNGDQYSHPVTFTTHESGKMDR